MHRFANMLFVMDGDLNAIPALEQVIAVAKENEARLTVLDVIESLPPRARMLVTSVSPGDLKDKVIHERLAQLETLVSMIGRDAVGLRVQVLFGKRAREIAREAAEGGYDLVIKSPEKGRTDKQLLRHCRCPVWILRSEEHRTSGRSLASLISHHAAKDEKTAGDMRLTSGARLSAR